MSSFILLNFSTEVLNQQTYELKFSLWLAFFFFNRYVWIRRNHSYLIAAKYTHAHRQTLSFFFRSNSTRRRMRDTEKKKSKLSIERHTHRKEKIFLSINESWKTTSRVLLIFCLRISSIILNIWWLYTNTQGQKRQYLTTFIYLHAKPRRIFKRERWSLMFMYVWQVNVDLATLNYYYY